MKWYLRYRLKYQSKWFSQKEIAGAVGTGYSTYHEHLEEGHETAFQLALADYHKSIERLENEGRECAEKALAYKQAAPDRLRKLAELFQRKNPIPSSWEISNREKEFPEHGYSRIDFMYRTSTGDLGIGDYKTRGRIQANQIDKTRREFGTSGQLMQYCWMASEVMGEPVDQYSIVITTLEPRPLLEIWQYRIKPGTLETFIAGRKQAWADMEAIIAEERTPYMADVHENKYGQCESYDICFRYGFDEQLMSDKFVILN
jgi:hypothetical protein